MQILLKRYSLVLIVNFAISLVILTLFTVFGGEELVRARYDLDLSVLLLGCAIFGFFGAFLSLLLSRWMAKRLLRVTVIPADKESNLQWLTIMVQELSRDAGLSSVPEVGIYRSEEVNAFATGPSQKRSLVAFSSGLIQKMDKTAIRGVAAHELAHIKNGDMVTMTLLQGILNTFVFFFAHLLAQLLSSLVRDRAQHLVYYLVLYLSEFVFGLFGLVIASAFSRHREFIADAGSAKLAGESSMIRALEILRNIRDESDDEHELPATISALGINGDTKSWFKYFSTHPPLERRIEALKCKEYMK